MKNKISIIVPIFNSEKYLTRCLASLQNQTLGDYEVILINDGSIDHSACICNEFVQKDNRFRVIHKKNGGVSSARNIGLAVTQGEYVLFVDSDDYIDRHLLENLLQVGSYDLVLTGLSCMKDDTCVKTKHVEAGEWTLDDLRDDKFYYIDYGEFYQFNLSSCIRQQNSLTAQFVSFSLSNLANIFYPPPIFTIINLCLL